MIVRDPEKGWSICVFHPEFKCWKILKLFASDHTIAKRLVALLSDKCMTIQDIARALGMPVQAIKGSIYYYYYSGLLYKEGPLFCLDESHPQVQLIKKLLTNTQLFIGQEWSRVVKSGLERTDSRYSEQSNEITLEKVLERAREVFNDLSPCEEAVIIALFYWWKKTGSPYDNTCDEVQLFEDLCSVYPELEKACRDSMEFARAVFGRLLRARVVYRWSRGSVCKVRLGKRVLPIGRGE